jgi:hypothetical protein
MNCFGMVSNKETEGETKEEPISIAKVIISQLFIENALRPKLYSYIFITIFIHTFIETFTQNCKYYLQFKNLISGINESYKHFRTILIFI